MKDFKSVRNVTKTLKKTCEQNVRELTQENYNAA
jgi:hypothetical protein